MHKEVQALMTHGEEQGHAAPAAAPEGCTALDTADARSKAAASKHAHVG